MQWKRESAEPGTRNTTPCHFGPLPWNKRALGTLSAIYKYMYTWVMMKISLVQKKKTSLSRTDHPGAYAH